MASDPSLHNHQKDSLRKPSIPEQIASVLRPLVSKLLANQALTIEEGVQLEKNMKNEAIRREARVRREDLTLLRKKLAGSELSSEDENRVLELMTKLDIRMFKEILAATIRKLTEVRNLKKVHPKTFQMAREVLAEAGRRQLNAHESWMVARILEIEEEKKEEDGLSVDQVNKN